MTTEEALTATKPRGRPFAPGNNANPSGRPKKGNALRDIVRSLSTRTKQEIVQIAVNEVIQNHDVAWAAWLLKAEGDDPNRPGLMRELVIREYGGFNPEEIE